MKLKRFPIGIFLLLFIIESLVAATAVVAYFIYAGKSQIEEMESYTRSYSISLAEAFSRVAEIGYRAKKPALLKTLFKEKIEEKLITEAFFVLKNGKIIAHSNKERTKQLKGNIASDEFAYNLDLILKPVRQKSREVLFSDYDIVDSPAPFERNERMLLKRYLYPKIDSTGWLASKSVFIKKKPAGVVGFIISKEKVYSFIAGHIERCKKILFASLCLSFVISLTIALVVLIRYRSIQKKSMGHRMEGAPADSWGSVRREIAEGSIFDMTPDEEPDQPDGRSRFEKAPVKVPSQTVAGSSIDLNKRVKDAIEVADEE